MVRHKSTSSIRRFLFFDMPWYTVLYICEGILSKMNRSFSHVIVWNDPNAPESASVSKSAMTIQRSWNAILSTLSFTVRFLEVRLQKQWTRDFKSFIILRNILCIVWSDCWVWPAPIVVCGLKSIHNSFFYHECMLLYYVGVGWR